MKRLLKIAFTVLAAAACLACSKDSSEDKTVYLSVNPTNLAGYWQLSEWNGKPLAEGNFAYIEITRQDKKFTMYENITGTSTVTREYTGTYGISDDDVIRGIYDNSIYTYWSHDYKITELTYDRMVWTATDDPDDVSVYVRVDAIPEY